MPTPAEIRAELERRKRAASAPVQAPAPVAPVSNADAIRAELARRKAAAPAPMSQPDASPWGNGQAFDDMYARKPQTDPMLSPLRPEARTLTSGAPTQMKPPPAPRGPVMSPAQRRATQPDRDEAARVKRYNEELALMNAASPIPFKNTGPDGPLELNQERPDLFAGRATGAFVNSNIGVANTLGQLGLSTANAFGAAGDPAMGGAMAGLEYGVNVDDAMDRVAEAAQKGGYVQNQQAIGDILPSLPIPAATTPGEMLADVTGNLASVFTGFGAPILKGGKALSESLATVPGMSRTLRGVGVETGENAALAYGLSAGAAPAGSDRNMAGTRGAADPLNYVSIEAARAVPRAIKALDAPTTPTNAGGVGPGLPSRQMPPVAPAVAATQTAQQAPTQPQTATAPPVPPIPPNAPAATVATPQPVPVTGAAPPAGQLTPVSSLGPAEQAFNNLPMKTRESMLNAFQSAGIEPNRAKAMIGELNNLPDGQNTMYALEVMRRNGLSDADIDGVLIAMGREFATESPRPAGRVFNREQDSARQIMNDQVRTQINSEGRSITDVAERNFGEGVVPAGEALDLELDQLSNAYETILSTKRSPTGRLRSPAKKDAVYKAREDLTNALVSPEVMQTIPQDVKLQIMMQASDDMRRLKFTPDELGLILQGDGKVLAPLFNGYGALSWSPDLWAHLARQYPTQAAHSLQSALRKAADEAFRRGDATAGRYYKRLRGESGKGGLLDTLERAVPKYKETRVQFGDASSAKEALDILERFKAAAASEGDVAKIIKDLEVLPQRHREMAEQQITSIIRQELARKVESPRLAELGQTVAQTPNLTSLSRQDFLKALEDVFGPRGKELADAIRAARARTDTLTSISPKYNSRTEVNRQDVQNAPALYEAPGSLEGGIIDAGVKRLGTVAGGASLIPGGQGAALALGAATAVQAAMNAARRGKRLSNAERNALVDFLFKSRTANDAAPPVATRGPSMGDYAQAIGRDAVIGAGVGAVADGDPLNNDPMALIGGAVGGATGYGRARIRNARSLIKPPPAPRGAGSRNPPPAGPGVGGPNAPRPLPGQTSNSAPAVTGALVGGAAGYAAAPEDQKGLGLVAGIAGGGVLANRLAKGSTPKAPPAVKAKPAFDQRFMKEAQRLVSYNGGVDKALKAQQYVIDQLKNSKAPNAEDRLNRAVSIQYAIRRMAERSNRELDEIVPIAEAAPTGPKPIDPNTNYNIDPRGDKFVIRTDAGEEVLGAPQFSDRKQALAWLQGETRKARRSGGSPKPRSGPPGVKPPPVKPARELYTAGDSFQEWGWSPSKKPAAPALKSGGGSVQPPTTAVPTYRKPPEQAGFMGRPTPPKGQKAPPKGPSFPPRLAADLNKSKVSPATRATLDQNAALPPGERKSVMEATGWSDDILRIAAPYIRPGTRMESEVGNRIARLVQQANANPVEYALRQTMAKGALEEAQKRFKQASGARSRAANNLENLRSRNMLNPNQPATQQQLTVHKQRRDDAEQFLSEAARLRDEAKVMLDRADVELMSLPQVRDFANKEIQRITDALGVGGKASPGTAQLPSYNPMVKGPKPIPKPGAVNRPSKQAADELAHLLFEQDMAEKFAKIQSGEITPTQRNTFQQVMSWYARHPSLAAVSVAAAGGSAVGYAALATDQGERAVQARENARKRSGQPEPELPGPPAWDWEKLSRNPRFAGDTQAALQALGYKIGKIDNNIRRADGKRTESEKALYHFLWTLDNTRDPEAPPTEAEWDALKEAALQARRRR